MQNKELIQENGIEIKDFIWLIWNKKFFILGVTLFITLCGIVYVYFKNPKPIYQGNLLVEIGEIQNENFGVIRFDNPYNLLVILEKQKNIKITIPKRSNKLLMLSVSSTNKQEIKNNLEDSFSFILERHKEKAKYYKNYIMTRKVGDINIDSNPINKPKKETIVIVFFITGLILSIFLVFFLESIYNLKNKQKEKL